MKAKKEYVIVGANKIGSTTYFYTPTYDNGNGWLPRPDYKHRYATIDLAKKALEEYLERPKCFNHIPNKTPIIIDSEDFMNPLIDYVWEDSHREGIFIVRVPSEYYVGDNYKKLLKYKREKRYTDDKRYQINVTEYGKKPLWLKISNGKLEWVKSRWQASFFNKDDVEKYQEEINHNYSTLAPKGYYPYANIHTLPYHIVNKPKFNKWDTCYFVDWESGRIIQGTIYDVFLESRKRWNNNDNRISFNYEIIGNPYVDNLWENELLTAEEFEMKYKPKVLGYVGRDSKCVSIVDLCGNKRKLNMIDYTISM